MIAEAITSWARSHPSVMQPLQKIAKAVGYDTTDWMRIVMYQRCFEFIRKLGTYNLDVLEIGAGPQWQREFVFKSYTTKNYPDFDICREVLVERFDLIIADQVFEHLAYPYRAGKNVYTMLRPGGYFLVTVPFLVKVHKSPIDCTRWTEDGLGYFLQECGFTGLIQTGSWGNRACVKANFNKWAKRGLFGSLNNEPDFPVAVWAFARR